MSSLGWNENLHRFAVPVFIPLLARHNKKHINFYAKPGTIQTSK